LRSTTPPPFIISNDKAPKKQKKQFTLSGFMSAVGWTFVVLAVACCVMGFVEKQDTSSSFLYLLAIAVICFVLAKVTKDKI
jgi:membrane protein DedA with SNARE-associated domain